MKCLFNGVPLPALPAKILAYPHIWIYSITGPDGKYVPFTVYATEDAPKAFLDSDGTTEYWGYETKATGISATVYIDDSEWTVNNYTISACTPYGPGWTNTDAYHLDGALWVAASDPIPILAPVIDPLSLFLGWKAGNWVARQRGKAKQPVAYLYNGVRLPKLPEWDKAKYPYAFIETTFGFYYLRVLANPLTPDGNSFRMTPPGLVAGAKIDIADYELIGWDEWSEVTEITRDPLWSNFDVLNEDGTVYLAASEPVPVYE